MYLLLSQKDDGFYIGFTGRSPQERLVEHQNGLVDSTRNRRPMKLVYIEGFANEEDAKTRESQLKNFGSAYKGLLLRIQRSVDQEKA